MKYIMGAMLLLSCAVLSATPDYLSFRLMLTDLQVQGTGELILSGDFTLTNNSDADWTYMFLYPQIGLIWMDEQDPPWMYFDLWTWVIVTAQGSVTYQINGGGYPCGPGTHTARARLFYTPGNQEAVGNTITFSLDQTLTQISDVTWNLSLTELGANYLNGRLSMTNANIYPWQREFPLVNIARLAVDGSIGDASCTPFPHFEYLAPSQERAIDVSYVAQSDFTPGDHTAQIMLLTPDPLPVGPVLTFHVQGTTVDDAAAPAFRAELFPHPLRPSSMLRLTSPQAGSADLALYNLKGQQVLFKPGLPLKEGENSWNWSSLAGRDLTPGIYMLRLKSPAGSSSRKLIVMP